MADTSIKTCEECGASVYPEHIEAHRAGVWAGKLYCIQCYTQHKSAQVTIDPDEFGGAVKSGAIPLSQPIEHQPEEDDPMPAEVLDDTSDVLDAEPTSDVAEQDDLDIEFSSISSSAKKIQAFSGTIPKAQQHSDDRKYTRHLNRTGTGALRCRIFHAKLNDGALKFMEDQINEWIDANPDIEIKSSGTQVGVVEGKSSEPHLILTLFY